MNEERMLAELTEFFGKRDAELSYFAGGFARFTSDEQNWQVSLCAGQAGEMEFLKAFEAGMERLIAIRQGSYEGNRELLGLVVSFGPVLAVQRPSYRRALKKYTSSIVFEDVGIALLLVSEGGVELVEPGEVNEFLRGLDARIRKARRS